MKSCTKLFPFSTNSRSPKAEGLTSEQMGRAADGSGQPGHIPVPPDLQKSTPEAGNNPINLLADISGPVHPAHLWLVDLWSPVAELCSHVLGVGTVSCLCQGVPLPPRPKD